MALTTINGRDGTGDLTITGQSYKTILREFENESNVRMIDTSVFANEGVATQDPGMEQLRFRLSGLGKKGAVQAGPFIPAPQNVTLVFQYSTGCTISYLANFDRALARRTVNENMIITGEGISNGAFVIAWVVS